MRYKWTCALSTCGRTSIVTATCACYVAVPGRKKARIKEQPGTPEFIIAYNAAIEGVAATPKARLPGRGSFGFVCKAYYASSGFKKNDPLTQAWKRNELDRICEKHGDKPIALMKPEHIRALRDEKPTPDGSNMRLKALRALFKWAVEAKEAPHNPAKEVAMVATNSDGYHTWTEDEIEQFEQRHAIGTKARIAMALMLYTTGRREDATRFGPAARSRRSHRLHPGEERASQAGAYGYPDPPGAQAHH